MIMYLKLAMMSLPNWIWKEPNYYQTEEHYLLSASTRAEPLVSTICYFGLPLYIHNKGITRINKLTSPSMVPKFPNVALCYSFLYSCSIESLISDIPVSIQAAEFGSTNPDSNLHHFVIVLFVWPWWDVVSLITFKCVPVNVNIQSVMLYICIIKGVFCDHV